MSAGPEKCQRCEEEDPDLRTIWMACFYTMDELGLPFERKDGMYTLRACKACRASWMTAIAGWFRAGAVTKPVPINSGIFVRRNEEWRRLNPGIEPVRVPEQDRSDK